MGILEEVRIDDLEVDTKKSLICYETVGLQVTLRSQFKALENSAEKSKDTMM